MHYIFMLALLSSNLLSIVAGSACGQPLDKSMIKGHVIDPFMASGSHYTITVTLKKCRCETCANPKKCDCCVDQFTTTTDDDNNFELSVSPGTYLLQAIAGKRKSKIIEVELGSHEQKDIKLKIGISDSDSHSL